MSRLRKILFTVTVALMTLATGAAWWAYGQIGKTPGELMDYAQRRLQGHDKLEWVALPIMAQLRIWLDQPSRDELLKIPFVIPPPPALVKTPLGNPDIDTSATDPAQRILRVGPYEDIGTIAKAAKLAKDGDIIEIQAGEYYGDVALWMQKKLTIRARGGNARLFAAGKSAQHKAIWVIRNGDFHIENIDFIGTRVYDHNGAGIRFEGGNLHIKNCLFYANDTGLLVNSEADTVTIENSEFAYNGFGDGFSHNLYVNKIRSLKITGSYFHHVNVGHLIKSRAQNNYIYYNRVTDESGGRASYELDLPNGGNAYVIGNIFQQDFFPQNSTLIAYGEEGLTWSDNKLYLASNTIVNDQPHNGTFLLTASDTENFVSVNNLLIGKGRYHRGTANEKSSNNIRGEWDIFLHASRYDYRLSDKGKLLSYVSPATSDLVPQYEYIETSKTNRLNQTPSYPGAVQR